MKAKIILSIPAFIIFSIGSSGQNSPVETQSPNTNYRPAHNGQTRVAGVKNQNSL